MATQYKKATQQSIHAALLSMMPDSDTINYIMWIWCSNECSIWRHHKMPQLVVTTQKIVLFFNTRDIFLLEEGVECLCKSLQHLYAEFENMGAIKDLPGVLKY